MGPILRYVALTASVVVAWRTSPACPVPDPCGEAGARYVAAVDERFWQEGQESRTAFVADVVAVERQPKPLSRELDDWLWLATGWRFGSLEWKSPLSITVANVAIEFGPGPDGGRVSHIPNAAQPYAGGDRIEPGRRYLFHCKACEAGLVVVRIEECPPNPARE